MGLGAFTGHNSGNDDLGGPGTSTPQVDPNAFQFGGRGPDQGVIGHGEGTADGLVAPGDILGNIAGTGSAPDEANRYRNLATGAGARSGPVTNYAGGDRYAARGLDSRAGQAGALSMIRQQATGAAPSAANLSMFRANDQSSQGALAAMAGARPGQAVAGQQAVGGSSMQQAANIGRAGNARAAEISGAQGALLGGYHNMREGDLGAMRAQDARTQHLANVVMGQRGLNQNAQMGFEGMGMDVRNAQLDANIYARMQAQRHRQQQANLDLASAGNASKTADMAASGISSAFSGGLGAAAGA